MVGPIHFAIPRVAIQGWIKESWETFDKSSVPEDFVVTAVEVAPPHGTQDILIIRGFSDSEQPPRDFHVLPCTTLFQRERGE